MTTRVDERTAIRVKAAPALGTLVTLANEKGVETLTLRVRRVGDDPALADWDRRQNYARYVGGDGLVLECEVVTEPPREMIAKRRGQGQAVTAEAERGLLRMGVPLAMLGHRPELDVTVELGGPRIALLVDGVLRDEEWPAGPWLPGKVTESSSRVALEPLGQEPVAALPPLTQYWAPPGHNAWAGDVMLTAADDRLHLFWLTDRRMHGSKYGCGGCSFAHASTTDLAHWEHHPLAYPLTEFWEAANGTGCCVVSDGVFHLFANVVTERLGLQDRYPNGPHLATSADGIHFTKQGRALGLPGEPGILRDEQGLWHAVSSSRHADGVWRTARYESENLRAWRMADPDFLPQPGWPTSRTVFSSECFNWFRWRDWYYVIGGRTGFWRSRQRLGPYRSPNDADGPRWDVYDGLMVPQVAVWKDRAILGGWLPLNDRDWGGHLVLRELRQRADGELELRRLPELAHPGVRQIWRVEPDPAEGKFALRWSDGLALDFDARQRTASAGGFSILSVDGLDTAFALETVLYYDFKSDSTILDVTIEGRRTLLGRSRGDASQERKPAAENCRLKCLESERKS